MSRSQTGSSISAPRAVVRSPRSITSVCPMLSSSSTTVFFAPSSSPETKTEWSPPATRPGSTMTAAVIVFSDLTTRASGKARWICSARESVSLTNRVGGKPWEKSSGLETSSSTLPARWAAPACARASREAPPPVALTTSSACSVGVGEGGQPDGGMVGVPGGEGRVAHAVGLGARERGLRIARPDRHLVAEVGELGGDGPADRSGTEDGDLHGALPVAEEGRQVCLPDARTVADRPVCVTMLASPRWRNR